MTWRAVSPARIGLLCAGYEQGPRSVKLTTAMKFSLPEACNRRLRTWPAQGLWSGSASTSTDPSC